MSVLAATVTQQAHRFETILNRRLYLFKISGSSIQLPPPQPSRSGDSYTIYIPRYKDRITLVDELGSISGSLTYNLENEKLSLKSYSFNFEHNSTYVQLHEDANNPHPKLKYGFHYDMDKEKERAIVHPLYHLQFSMLDVPRFEMAFSDNEIVVFDNFLELIKETFYLNSAQPSQKPKLECAQIYLSHYR